MSTGMGTRARSVSALIGFLVLGTALVACSSGSGQTTSAGATTTVARTSTSESASTTSAGGSSSTTWKGTVKLSALPLGDGKLSSSPKVGYVDSCTSNFRGGGARHDGPWIDTAAGTWDADTKLAVQGSVDWPAARHSITTSGDERKISTNDLPKGEPTGTFPIATTDPAYQYDTNPNHIGEQTVDFTVPVTPAAVTTPSCLGLGPIGVLSDGVFLYNALDDAGRDAVAHETQDECNGHPDGRERYHYHDVPVCIRDAAKGTSTLVGYAIDGYGIYVERDAQGNLPTNADLDACHGRTSPVKWDGKVVTMYHYDATLEYPYTLGCYHGTPTNALRHP